MNCNLAIAPHLGPLGAPNTEGGTDPVVPGCAQSWCRNRCGACVPGVGTDALPAALQITEALMAAGLHCTDYGRQVIAAARTTVPTRPDTLTSFQHAGASAGSRR
jgi:hypothetical protein